MDKGWTLPEIDNMDICWYLRLMGRNAQKGDGHTKLTTDAQGKQGMYIDQFNLF